MVYMADRLDAQPRLAIPEVSGTPGEQGLSLDVKVSHVFSPGHQVFELHQSKLPW
jgi:hypothetical protein